MTSLTSLRFFAALYVVVFHTAPPAIRDLPLGSRFAEGGYIGVSFFFVLSGYVLAWNYLDRFAQAQTNSRAFWRARLARIYPVYLVGLAVSLPFFVRQCLRQEHTVAAAAAEFARSAALALTLVQTWTPTHATVWNAPSWSLSVEAFFYLVFPLLAVAALALPRRRILPAIAAAWALGLVAPTLYNVVRPDGFAFPSYVPDAFWLDALKYMPLPHLFDFIIGVLGARWLLERREHAATDRKLDVTWPVLGIGLASLAIVMFLAHPLYLYLHSGLLGPAFLAIIVLLSVGDGVLVRALSRPTLVLLGEASYALYLIHVPLGAWFGVAAKFTHLPLRPWVNAAGFALFLVVALVASVAVLRWIEEPARRAIRDGRFPRLPRRVAPVQAGEPIAVPSEV